MKNFILLISLVLLMAGCASKRFVKKATELENSGLYLDAANNYYNSLQKNINNIDAKLGLQRTGQLVLDDKIDDFKTKYQSGIAKDAVYSFRDAEAYIKKLKGVGIQLLFPEEQRSYYNEMEDNYLTKLYGEAVKALNLEQFTTSEKQFSEILSINNNYKDAKSKWKIAKYEPIYRSGNEMMENQMYRSAYFTFKGIVDQVQIYENSLDLMNTSLDKAKVTMYVSAVNTNYSGYRTTAAQLNSKVINGINGIKSPLYEVVGTGTATQKSSNVFGKAFQYDRTKGVANAEARPKSKAVFESMLHKYSKSAGNLQKTEKRGFIKRTIEYKDKETGLMKTKVVYDKVRYYEYKLTRRVYLSLAYSLKRTDRDELAISDSYNNEEVERLSYAKFDGDYKKVIPGYWKYSSKDSDEDEVYDSASSISALKEKFEANKTPRSLTDMENDLMSDCVSQITKQIQNYKPEN
ncbi:hypothetical protein [Labilibacter marinus]|uniref:hypothetical protein n=1 Tax=Labilibacter marinus TaxID=1477105 RepID=UPI0009500AA7|nr:hypothetical protein [Labilibacter marinus]